MPSQAREIARSYSDSTGNHAAARVDLERQPKTNVSHILERATPAEVAKYQGVIFEPRNPVNLQLEVTKARQMIRSIEEKRLELKRRFQDDVQAVPEFRTLTAELFKARNALENAQAAKRR